MKVKAQPRELMGPLAGGTAGSIVSVEPLDTGWVTVPPAWLERAGNRTAQLRMLGIGTPRSRWLTIPCPSFLVTHPSAGPFLVDTGLHPSVTSKPTANLGRIATSYSKPNLEAGKDVAAQLRSRGLDARDIKTVVMTHMHLDHTSAMSELGSSTFVLSDPEWVAATTTSNPSLHGYATAHFDYAFDYRTVDFDGPSVSSYSTFGRTFDLFGDGSVRLAFTPGHTLGHMSLICRLRNRDLVIAGDAIYTLGQLDDAPPPPLPEDSHTWRRSQSELKLFRRQYPQAVIIPSHDHVLWETLENRYE
ncbi:MAG: N-acyl homoserine lactonase family protein [Actinomycetota bacterium]|nr:N-acyl homoserine lactonase family protein [Actinomycetota bacterium]